MLKVYFHPTKFNNNLLEFTELTQQERVVLLKI